MIEALHSDLTTWEVGPYHSMLPGPIRLKLRVDGEVVVAAEYESGFLHRGIEKAMELHLWSGLIPYGDRLDPETALFGELAVCLAVEEMAEISVPSRAKRIRLILSELSRISGHMVFIAKMARAAGAETLLHYVLRDREKILDLFELLTGARFSISFLRFGGVCQDVTDGFVERVFEVCELIRHRLREYNDLFSFNRAFIKRTTGLAVLTEKRILELGITGPNARAAGRFPDVRKALPYIGYETVDFGVPVGGRTPGQCDAHDRFIVRIREIAYSLEALRQTAETIPAGEFRNHKISPSEFVPSRGEAYSRVESARGLLGCHLVSDGGGRPCRVQFRVPSTANLSAAPELLEGARIEDIPVILASLDISVAEADK